MYVYSFFFVLCVYYFKFYYIKLYDIYVFFFFENFFCCNCGWVFIFFGMYYVVFDWLCLVVGDIGDYEKFKFINGDICILMYLKKNSLV